MFNTDESSAKAEMTDIDALTASDLRTSADHLRSVLEAIDSGTLEATGRERAFIAGALCTVEVMSGHAGVVARVEPRSNDRLLGGVSS